MSKLLRAIPEARLVTHEDPCKGLIFRASVKSYINGGNIIVRKHLNLLKRKSCTGCERCDWILESDNLPEYINYFTNQDVLEKLKHGQLYTVSISGGGRDYWGEYDDIDYDFVEYNEESEVRGD